MSWIDSLREKEIRNYTLPIFHSLSDGFVGDGKLIMMVLYDVFVCRICVYYSFGPSHHIFTLYSTMFPNQTRTYTC